MKWIIELEARRDCRSGRGESTGISWLALDRIAVALAANRRRPIADWRQGNKGCGMGMKKRDAFAEFIENELDMHALDALAAAHRRRQQEAINELLNCLEELRDLLSGYSPYGRIPPKKKRE